VGYNSLKIVNLTNVNHNNKNKVKSKPLELLIFFYNNYGHGKFPLAKLRAGEL
jgi:hypothetical protein